MPLRLVLYFCLLVTAAISLFTRPYLLAEIRAEHFPAFWILVGPVLFGVFFSLFCLDELFLRKRQKDGKKRIALVPIAFGALLFVMLFPSSLREYKARKSEEISSIAFYSDLINSKDARIRALVVIASSYTLESGTEWLSLMQKALQDKDPLVQNAALQQVSEQLGLRLPMNQEGFALAKSSLDTWDSSSFTSKKGVK